MTHPSKKHLDKIIEWLFAHWDDWSFVTTGNPEAMRMLLDALKAEGVIHSLTSSHSRVALAIKQARTLKLREELRRS